MFVKGIALTALVASTPFALFVAQDPVSSSPGVQDPKPAERTDARNYKTEWQRSQSNVKRARAELKAAQRDLKRLKTQLEAALDRIDEQFVQERDRNCSPSRGRAMMSHYQWLRDQGHQQRASGALAKVVKQVGDNASRLNSVAWDLMTDKATAGKFDEVALALTQRMERNRNQMHYNHLDTAALAYFLNGKVDKAITLQQQAIAKGGRNDDFRRRLRTYEAAHKSLVQAQQSRALPAATMVATADDEDDE